MADFIDKARVLHDAEDMDHAGEIDVTLVACHRPELLAVTLGSFQDRLFGHFRVRRAFANIDPIWGDAAAGDACAALIREVFPEAVISRPAAAGFGQAVKHVWEQTSDRPVFHLEDDWIACEDITPEMVLPHFAADVGMVAPAHRARRAQDTDFAMRDRKIKLFGVTLRRVRVNLYGTSPRFLASGLARRYAELLDPRLDPEKQVYTGANASLCRLQERFRCKMIWGTGSGPLIEDIGRDWRDTRRIRKINTKAEVRWVDESPGE